MKDILSEIQDGTFVQKWVAEYDAGLPNYRRWQQADKDHPIEQVGKELRAKMQWLQSAPAAPANAAQAAPATAAAGAPRNPIAETA
jgi:ketol-acid reductoisomerase